MQRSIIVLSSSQVRCQRYPRRRRFGRFAGPPCAAHLQVVGVWARGGDRSAGGCFRSAAGAGVDPVERLTDIPRGGDAVGAHREDPAVVGTLQNRALRQGVRRCRGRVGSVGPVLLLMIRRVGYGYPAIVGVGNRCRQCRGDADCKRGCAELLKIPPPCCLPPPSPEADDRPGYRQERRTRSAAVRCEIGRRAHGGRSPERAIACGIRRASRSCRTKLRRSHPPIKSGQDITQELY